jgi:hypothetical protein
VLRPAHPPFFFARPRSLFFIFFEMLWDALLFLLQDSNTCYPPYDNEILTIFLIMYDIMYFDFYFTRSNRHNQIDNRYRKQEPRGGHAPSRNINIAGVGASDWIDPLTRPLPPKKKKIQKSKREKKRKAKITELAWIRCGAPAGRNKERMAAALLLRRACSAFLSSTTTGPLPRLRQPRAAMATDSSAAPFQKIQIQREDTVRGPALTLSPALSSVSYLSTRKTRRLGRAFLGFFCTYLRSVWRLRG